MSRLLVVSSEYVMGKKSFGPIVQNEFPGVNIDYALTARDFVNDFKGVQYDAVIIHAPLFLVNAGGYQIPNDIALKVLEDLRRDVTNVGTPVFIGDHQTSRLADYIRVGGSENTFIEDVRSHNDYVPLLEDILE
ncbi:hypothetical protein HOL21_04830 [Candidatus Woesearchaeota archaeon]|jgi:hypothetical protein|nr:hypothetical protein [Candidatus Woesearchaeota archaeon]MBT5397511.1 hypothetical protein [Candidatus Woesearchaeota archaeon]MBT6367916.1 hypothetical protein [Candidatus Woesearchaeota archaeon]MBT7763140.1 hypothetical protein [Candidatus Woesearchaeota archaeon]